jgi:hypothetical protein
MLRIACPDALPSEAIIKVELEVLNMVLFCLFKGRGLLMTLSASRLEDLEGNSHGLSELLYLHFPCGTEEIT